MKLSSLTLSNYRGFEQIDIQFCDDLTVIAGINGIGKSGLLKALRQLLSYFEENVLGMGQNVLLEATDVQIGKNSMSLGVVAQALGDKVDVQLGRTIIPESEFAEIQEKIPKLRQEMRVHPKRSSEAIRLEVEIEFLENRLRGFDDSESIYAPAFEKKEAADEPLPVFAYYSVNRAFTDLPKKLLSAKPLSLEAAHENSLTGGRVNLNDFANWFRVALDGELGSNAKSEKLWSALESTIKTILPEFKDLKLEKGERRLPNFSIAKNGVRFSLNQLSDGERALLALATDLTQRLSLANPDLDEPAKEGVGIVLIDEIELHLHPKWQRQVLRRLTEAFPNCQFVVTTHSALVLGEVKAECVRFLEPNEDTGRIEVYTPDESFGLDANRVLDELMGASERNKKVLEDLTALFRLIDEEKFDEAREAMKPLVELLGDNEPELTRAQALIKFLEGKE
jgi:predicted ATP-binding protein involved in virulence